MRKQRKQEEKGNRGHHLKDAAEEKLARSPGASPEMKEKAHEELVHELQVHQIEIEMQNDELKKAQLALEESVGKYIDLYDFAPIGYFTFTPEALIAEVNLTGAALLGVARQRLINNRFRRFVAPEDAELWDCHIVSVFQHGEKQSCDLALKRDDGSTFHARLDSVRMDVSGGTPVVRTAVSDITERKQAEELMRESEERYRSVVQAASDAIISADINGNIIFWNDAAERIFGYSAEEAMSKLFTFIMPEGLQDYMKKMFRQVASTGQLTLPKGMIVEGKGIRKDGSEFPVENSLSSWKTKEGTYFTAIIRDITERKHINGLKDDFIGTVSHELRTPLAITKEGLSLVLEEIAGPVNEEQTKLLTAAKNNIDRLARLINDLLDISKLEADRVELERVLVDFSVMIRSICDRWKTETDKNCQSLECCVPDVPINIYIDSDKIIQVMDNLIANAVKFTPKEGKISVELKDRNDQIEISISDTGIGIAKENLPKVFGKFQQFSRTEGAGYKGTGLGLAIVKELVKMHKGEIKVKSEFNRGSKFTFSLPKMEAIEVFKESINNKMKEADDKNVPLSFLVIYIVGFTELQEKLGADKAHDLRKDIEKQVRGSLRRAEDAVFNYEDTIIVLLPNCNKGGASSVRERLQATLDDYLVREKITDKVTVQCDNITYPDGIADEKALFKKAENGTGRAIIDEIMELF